MHYHCARNFININYLTKHCVLVTVHAMTTEKNLKALVRHGHGEDFDYLSVPFFLVFTILLLAATPHARLPCLYRKLLVWSVVSSNLPDRFNKREFESWAD
jgi:hypothetical protein